MLLCCFRDSSSDKDDHSRSGRRQKYRDGHSGRRAVTNPGLARDNSTASRISSTNECGGVLLAPVTFHPAPNSCDPRSGLPQPYQRSVSVCSDQQSGLSLSRQSSQVSTQLGLIRPHSRDATRRDKERAPLSKEAKRLMKQRSQESVRNSNGDTVAHQQQQQQQQRQQQQPQQQSQSDVSIPFIDQSPKYESSISQDDDPKDVYSVNSMSPLRQFADEKRRRSQCSTISVPNLPTAANATSVNVSPVHQTPPQQQQQQSQLSSKPFQSSSTQLSKVEEKIVGRGMCRSSASYGIQQMLQEQIAREETEKAKSAAMEKEMSKIVASYEEKMAILKTENNQRIQQVLRETATSINNAKNKFESELQRRTSELENNLRNQNASELQALRAHHTSEIEALQNHYENALAEAEERHLAAIQQFRERDESWQAEKQEVLGEIQRLKEEASRFIAILSQEEEYEKSDQQLSPNKRQALTREVESLQLVVEMRSAEVRQLREERGKLLEQLEAFETTRNLLEKMNARVEDLQAQLEAKNEIERQLSLENSKLENYYETESKNKARMSMQVEELQWRIKHNLDLPPTQIFSPGSPMSMDESQWAEMTSSMSMSANQIHPFDDVVVLRKPKCKTANSTPMKTFYFSNNKNNNNAFEDWAKEEHISKESNGFSLSSPMRSMNKNEVSLPVVTPTSAENNNIVDASMATADDDVHEKRDASTEKQVINHNNSNGNNNINNNLEEDEEEDECLIIAADSLENLKLITGHVADVIKVNHNVVDNGVLGFTEDDEGLGDINHGSEASSSPQPLFAPCHNNSSNSMEQQQQLVSCSGDACDKKSVMTSSKKPQQLPSSPSDERVPSRIPFSVQTNI